MGHVSVYEIARARSMGEAYDKLYEDAQDEHGHEQGYSGAINSSMFRGDITSRYNAATDKKKFIEDVQNNASGECYGICLIPPKANPNKVKSVVTITPNKGARKWVTRYIAENFDGRQIASDATQGGCVKKARPHVEKTGERVFIRIAKMLESGTTEVGRIEYKQSKKESLGKYLFIGDARE